MMQGSGAVALRWAISQCREVHMYGFTVDAGYSKWSRYFSGANAGHSPLTGRSYFQVSLSTALSCCQRFKALAYLDP
jgi:hypothetical protein